MKTYIVEVINEFPVQYKGVRYPKGAELEVAEKDLNGEYFEVKGEAPDSSKFETILAEEFEALKLSAKELEAYKELGEIEDLKSKLAELEELKVKTSDNGTGAPATKKAPATKAKTTEE